MRISNGFDDACRFIGVEWGFMDRVEAQAADLLGAGNFLTQRIDDFIQS